MFQLTDQQNAEFHRDGFVVVDGLIDDHTIDQLREAFERIFSGRFGLMTARPLPSLF